MGIYSFISCTQ